MGDIIKLVMVTTGLIMLIGAIMSLAKRRMIESYTILWSIVGVVLLVAGIIISPYQVTYYFSNTTVIAVAVIGVTGLIGAFAMSTQISELIRQNREQSMSMAVMAFEIKRLREENGEKEEAAVRE